jgi:O-antigen biosynthesis protein
MSFTVVVCTRNRPELLDRCLASVSKLDYPDFEVLVVDNAPSDARSLDVAQRWRARYCLEPVPGLSRARNRGVRVSRSELIAFIDDDEIPDALWLRGLAAEFDDPHVMAVTGRILPLIAETNGGPFLMAAGDFDRGLQKRTLDRETPCWFEIANFGGIGDGGNMAFRRCAFEIWSGFDVRLGRGTIISGSEEHRAFLSLVDRGYRVVYAPEAVVRHPSAEDFDELRARHLDNRTSAIAYMALLFTEESRYRRAVIKYFAEGLIGKRRTWRSFGSDQSKVTSLWSELIAATRGLFLYLKMRIEGLVVIDPRVDRLGYPQANLGSPTQDSTLSVGMSAERHPTQVRN